MPEEVRLPFLIGEVSEEMQISQKDVKTVLETFFQIVGEELAEGNTVYVGSWFKLSFRAKAAVKKGTMVRNPFSGEETRSPGKPAELSVKATVLSGLKTSAPGVKTEAGKAILDKLTANSKARA